MATSNRTAWTAMTSHIAATGYTPNVMIGEPRSGVQSRMVSVLPTSGEVDETTLSGPREVHRVIVRMYVNWLDEGQDETEFLLDQFRADIEEDFFGDFELGGNVAYALPTEFAWEYGTEQVENTVYRTIDITIGYRVDDRATFTP